MNGVQKGVRRAGCSRHDTCVRLLTSSYCTANPVLGKVVQKWPVPVHGGLPLLTEDLQWNKKTHPNLFVVGALAALQMGPDAGNLMGLRRAATVVANALECRCWLREKSLANPFEALFDDDSDTESESDDSY